MKDGHRSFLSLLVRKDSYDDIHDITTTVVVILL